MLNVLLNHAKYPKKVAPLHITPFYNSKIFTFNKSANLFRENDFHLREKLSCTKKLDF